MRAGGVDGKHERREGTDYHRNTNENAEWNMTDSVKKYDNGRNNHRVYPDHNGRFAVNHVEGIDVHLILIPKKGAKGLSRLFFGIVERAWFFLFENDGGFFH